MERLAGHDMTWIEGHWHYHCLGWSSRVCSKQITSTCGRGPMCL